MNKLFLTWLCIYSTIASAGSPVIWNGSRSKFLPANGLTLGDYTTVDHDGMQNQIKNARAEADTLTGWSTYADAAGTSPVDCTGGSPNSTFTRSTSTPLEGQASWLLTKNAGASRQGEGAAYSFTVPYIDTVNKPLYQVSFVDIGSANYADGKATVYFYDVTNSAIVAPSSTSLTSGQYVSTFSVTSGTSYRMCIHISSAVDEAWTLKIDRIYVGPGQLVQGAPISDWKITPTELTPSITQSTGTLPTNTQVWEYSRVGDTINLRGRITWTGTGTWASLRINLPTGAPLDTTKWTQGWNNTNIQFASAIVAGSHIYPCTLLGVSSSQLAVQYLTTTGIYTSDFTQSSPATWAITDYVDVGFSYPVSGWSSGIMISSTETKSPAKAGFIQEYAGTTAPTGWKICDGSAISRTTYSQLFANIGTTWGTGDGSTTFNIPDMRGVFAKGAGTTSRTLGKDANGNYYSSTIGTYYTDKMQGHRHTPNEANNFMRYLGTGGDRGGIAGSEQQGNPLTISNPSTDGTNGTPRTGMTTEPQSASVNYIIKLYDDSPASVAGFNTATVGNVGLVNNSSTNTAGTPIKGATDGSSASAGYVGYAYTSTGSINTTKTGSVGGDVIFDVSGAPTLNLPAGSYLIIGGTGIKNGTTLDDTVLYIYDGSSSYGGTAGVSVTGGPNPFTTSAFVTFSGANRTFYLRGVRSGGSSLIMGGGVNTTCGYLSAVVIR
jgi:microcystin-dependent protein